MSNTDEEQALEIIDTWAEINNDQRAEMAKEIVALIEAARAGAVEHLSDKRDWTKELLDDDSYDLRLDASRYITALKEHTERLEAALQNARRAMIVSVTGVSDGLTIHDIRGWIEQADAALPEGTTPPMARALEAAESVASPHLPKAPGDG